MNSLSGALRRRGSHHYGIISRRDLRFVANRQYNHSRIHSRKRTIHSLSITNTLRLSNPSLSTIHRYFSSDDSNHNGQQQPPEKLVSITDENYQEIIDRIPLQDVRNFCFIAHVDHGKSSLSSRLLEITGNMGHESQKIALDSARGNASAGVEDTEKDAEKEIVDGDDKEQIQLLDTLAVERERGITVKASAASMLYPHPSAVGPDGVLLLNCVDTPGHSDFSSEVARSLSFVQGAVLLLDATQGIQAQSWTVHEKAKSMVDPPELILAMTKIDLDAARPIDVALTVSEWLSVDDPESIIPTSARSRIGIVPLLDAICRRVPPPKPMPDDKDSYTSGTEDNPHLRIQVVDSWYDSRGVNCIVQVMAGVIKEGDRIAIATKTSSSDSSQSFSSFLLPPLLRLLPSSLCRVSQYPVETPTFLENQRSEVCH